MELPAWWWLLGSRPVSAGATIGPDWTGPDAHLLEIGESDDGVDGDRCQPATCGAALNRAIDTAPAAKAALSRTP